MRDKMIVDKHQTTMNLPFFSAQSLQPYLPKSYLPGWVTMRTFTVGVTRRSFDPIVVQRPLNLSQLGISFTLHLQSWLSKFPSFM